jgi:NAD+ diphosphatase
MLHTPSHFTPLLATQDHVDPHCMVFQQGRLLLRDDNLALPDMATAAHFGAALPWQPVGILGDRYCQTAWVDGTCTAPAGHSFHGLRSLFGTLDDGLLGVTGRASQIAEWARTHRYCGACAAPTVQAEGERCFTCPACGHLAYPRISPAMMVLIRKGEQVLLAFHTQSPSKRFSPLAGFLEAGESIEEAVHREVAEEVGLRVHNLRYFASQSWPFPHSLMIAFTADYLDGEIAVDGTEIAEARWFGPGDAWPEPVPSVSISSMLVDAHRPR